MARPSATLANQADPASTPNTPDSLDTNPPQDVVTQKSKSTNTSAQHNPSAPFRFLDLPAELRNSIYSHYFASTPNHNFSAPAPIFVSKQLQKESLPIFFSDTNFHRQLGANFLPAYYITQFWGFEAENKPGWKTRAGVLNTNAFVSANKDIAIFRNVTFEVYDTMTIVPVDGVLVQSNSHFPDAPLEPLSERHFHVLFDMQVGVGGGHALEVTARDGRMSVRHDLGRTDLYPEVQDYCLGQLEVVEEAVEKATAIARGMAAKEGFKGFTISDLREIAMAFRLE